MYHLNSSHTPTWSSPSPHN